MPSPPTADVLLEDAPRRARAQRRLYVLCQMGGWMFFLLLQLVFARVFSMSEPAGHAPDYWGLVQVIATGLLLTHGTRPYLARWGWKDLGWRPLVPRILALGVVLAFVWCVFGYGWKFGVLHTPWPAKYHPLLLFGVSWINGAVMLVGWLCLYFFYHLFDRYNRLEIERLRLGTSVKEAELRVVNDYLALEQVRHEERLRVRLDIAPDTLALPVPPMLLQTLVENAVKYGISARPEGGEIAIVARRESGSLRLQVTNPGELAPAASHHRVSSTGVGLRNAAERLRLLFGETASLRLRADTPALVVAEAIVPFQPARV